VLIDWASGEVVAVNTAAARLLGSSEAQLLGTRSGTGAVAVLGDVRDELGVGATLPHRRTAARRLVRPDGTVVWARALTSVLAGPDGHPRLVVAQLLDLTEEHDAAEALMAAQARFAALIEHGDDLIAVSDASNKLVYASPAYRRVLGLDPAARVGRPMSAFVHPDDHGIVGRALGKVLATPGAVGEFECRIAHADGSWRNAEITCANRLSDPAVRGIVTNTRDVTERVTVAAQLAHQATHDALTGLPNRVLLLDRLSRALDLAERTGQGCAVLYVDIDRFKTINDSMGHGAGDRLLMVLAERMGATLRPGDTIARLGGDEFVVLAEGVSDATAAIELAERIKASVSRPLMIGGRDVVTSCSVGIALADRHRPDVLLQEADTALYRAKELGRNRSELYDRAMRSAARRRLDTERVLRHALTNHGVVVAYQSIVELRTGRPQGVEALLRVRDEQANLLVPTQFIDVAEDSGLIVPMGAEVLSQACRQAADWSRHGHGEVIVSVNLSAQQLCASGLVGHVAEVLVASHLPPAQLCVELTENALIDAGSEMTSTVEDLAELGVRIAIDDFGTGWSSLAYLRKFPVHMVKIDRSFIAGVLDTPADVEVVKAVIGLAQALGLTTVAEGVESEAQAEVIRRLGCDMAQGYLYDPPGPADHIEARLRVPPTKASAGGRCITPG